MEIKFILVERKDIKLLASLASEIWHEYWPCILSLVQIDYMIKKFQSEEAILKQINEENYSYYFILNDDEKIGYIGVSNKEDYLFLSKLYLKKDYRFKGIGRKAFQFVKTLSDKKIILTVNKQNKNTIAAYLKYGLTIKEKNISDIGEGFVMDDYIMEYSNKKREV